MRLPDGGMDIYYVDESTDRDLLVMSAIPIPFLRSVAGTWTVVWDDHLENIRNWRRRMCARHGISVRKELKGSKLLPGRGRYVGGKHQLHRGAAASAMRDALADLSFLPPNGIITVVGEPGSTLYGHGRLEAVLYALLQRMRTACMRQDRLGLVFFDEGHGEYRKLYRKARSYLPTGSDRRDWGDGKKSKNLPLDNFTKDANIKQSGHSLFIQLADLVSFVCLLRMRGERNALVQWQRDLSAGSFYDAIPISVLNVFACRQDPMGIVRLA